MSTLGTELSAQISAACLAGAAEAGGAIGRCFGGEFQISPGEPRSLSSEPVPSEWSEAGLILLMHVGSDAAAVLIPETTGMLPAWYRTPDATSTSKLTTLAQEFGMLFLPEEQMPEDFSARAVIDMSAALLQAEMGEACLIPLTVRHGDVVTECALVWPLPNHAGIVPINAPAAAVSPPPTATPLPFVQRPPAVETSVDIADALASMPPYIRSLLRIKVDLSVKLAETKQAVKKILELGPGSIIQFDKSCEQPLSLIVGSTEIAVGEAVKVGDKFGLRINSMVLPPERFLALSRDANRRAS